MKNKKIFFVAIFCGLVASMTWTSCEKSTVQNAYPDPPFISPDLIDEYVTEKDIIALRSEVSAMAPPEANMELVPVVIRMHNDVEYNAAVAQQNKTAPGATRNIEAYHETIFYNGEGEWNAVGSISYKEKLSLPHDPSDNTWIGKGNILVSKMLDTSVIPPTNKLLFLSGFRYETSPLVSLGDEEFANPEKVVESRLLFKGGQGIFSQAKGRAMKLEFYFGDENSCLSYIYGFVLVKTREGAEHEIQDVE